MKRVFGLLAAAIFVLSSASAFAEGETKIHHDSTWLASNNVLSTNVAKGKGGSGVAVGTVVAWTQNWIPEGWLECNGQSTAAYPELAAVVGSTIPDYRGRFLRHVGWNSAALNVAQGDATRRVTGRLGWSWYGLFTVWSGAFRKNLAVTQSITHQSIADTSRAGNVDFDNAIQVPVADEIRPTNMAVKYIMFAGN